MAVYRYCVLSLSNANAGRIPWVARTLRIAAVCAGKAISGSGDQSLGVTFRKGPAPSAHADVVDEGDSRDDVLPLIWPDVCTIRLGAGPHGYFSEEMAHLQPRLRHPVARDDQLELQLTFQLHLG